LLKGMSGIGPHGVLWKELEAGRHGEARGCVWDGRRGCCFPNERTNGPLCDTLLGVMLQTRPTPQKISAELVEGDSQCPRLWLSLLFLTRQCRGRLPEHYSNYLPRGVGDVTKHEQRGGGRSVISEQVLISTISIQKTVLCASWEESLKADLALTR
jgi:hypothetical protein